MPDNAFRQNLLKIAAEIADASDGQFRLAKGEADQLRTPEKQAATFLKYDERRFGRDIELYGLMSSMRGEDGALVQFAQEIVLPLKNAAPASYAVAAESMKSLGRKIFPAKMIDDWNAIFDEPPTSGPTP
jgi:hypothetical protein